MSTTHRMAVVSFMALSVFVAATQAAIVDVRVDFSASSAAAPSATDNDGVSGTWNTFSSPTEDTALDLVDYAPGTPSQAKMTLAGDIAWRNSTTTDNWNASNAGPGWLDASRNAALDRFWADWNATWTVTFSGLDSSKLYDLEVISSKKSNGRHCPFQITTGTGDDTVYDWYATDDGYTPGGWMSWEDVSPDASGTIVLKAGKALSASIYINAMRLVEVPEPATMGMLGLGTLGLSLLRRRRKSV